MNQGKPLVSIILPTLGRVKRLKTAVNSLWKNTSGFKIECIVVSEELESQTTARELGCILLDKSGTAVEKWNEGASIATGEWISLGADDLVYHPGWLEAALEADKGGYVGFNDLYLRYRHFATHFMLSRSFAVTHNGGCLAIPHYHSWCLDVETAERAQRAGVYVFAEKAIVEHRHVAHRKAWMDKTYKIGKRWHDLDEEICKQRRLAGWPDDFEAVFVK